MKKILSSHCLNFKRFSNLKQPVVVSITGDNGWIGYATVFKVAEGHMLGYD